jgi:hypothetical protein
MGSGATDTAEGSGVRQRTASAFKAIESEPAILLPLFRVPIAYFYTGCRKASNRAEHKLNWSDRVEGSPERHAWT